MHGESVFYGSFDPEGIKGDRGERGQEGQKGMQGIQGEKESVELLVLEATMEQKESRCLKVPLIVN